MFYKGKKIRVSIIIPIYNAEKFLGKCLESIQNQTLREIEIICVDDGSTDRSLGLVKEYAKEDDRIRVIHQENGGLVSARKAGIKAASGQYTGYVDSDDWIDPEMYRILYCTAVENQVDLVSSGYYFEGNYVTEHYDGILEGLYAEDDIAYLRENAIYNLETKEVGIRGSLCCKLFRTDLLKTVQAGIREGLSFSEDKICVLSFLLQCRRAYVLKRAFYHYIVHASSMVHVADTDYLIRVNEVYQSFIELYGHPDFTPSMRMQAEIYVTELLYKGINSRLGFVNSSLFWLDPYYLADIPGGTRVVLYGGGELGRAYRKQLLGRKELKVVGCVDPAYRRMREDFAVCSPNRLEEWEYDIILITVKNRKKAAEIRKLLMERGIAEQKIRWYEQKEIFWKYAEVNGWFL